MYTLQSTKNVKIGDTLQIVKRTSKLLPEFSIKNWGIRLEKKTYPVYSINGDDLIGVIDDDGYNYSVAIDQFVKVKKKKT